MNPGNLTILELYQGLIALPDRSFPKKCRNCGRLYQTPADYIKMTTPVGSGSGLQSFPHTDEDMDVVHLFRNCPCGSTLVGAFHDRRDTSPPGLRRRSLFEVLLKRLVSEGLEMETAKTELIKVMHGEFSVVLEPFGIVPPPMTGHPRSDDFSTD